MTRFLLRRAASVGVAFLLASVLVFIATQLVPGDVARIILGREAGDAALEAFREEFGLNRPAIVRYATWLAGFVRGDWGTTMSTRSAIRPLVASRLRLSLMLAGVALVLAVPLSIFLGIVAGVRAGGLLDQAISIGSLAVVGLPEFVTAVLLIQILAHGLGLLPPTSTVPPGSSFGEAFRFLLLPALTATLVLLAYVARLTRAQVVEQLGQPYIRTATLKGLPRRTVIVRHLLRNALLPTITVVAISVSWLIGGIIVIENVFNYPGLGRLLLFAIDRRDFPLMQSIAMVIVLFVLLSNVVADLLYGLLNPRIRLR
jgi:peptide/nickel transport system permease protein